MNYIELLKTKAKETKSIVCVGFDPVLEEIPLSGNPKKIITKFYFDLIEGFISENILPSAIKPNIAFFEHCSNLNYLLCFYKS